MANVSSHLYTHSYLSPPALLPLCHSHCRSISILNRRFLFISSSSLHILCRSQRWDSNAESYNTKNFNFDTGSYTDEAGDIEQLDGVLEDYIDSFWILKVFKFYGWMLPIIIISMLLADGPKAFLLALALPLGQSTFTFAFQRMQNDIGKHKNNPEPTKTKKRKSRAHNSKNATLEKKKKG